MIHGNHTTSKKPILANDPHLNNEIPTFWYLAELIFQHEGEELYITGGTGALNPFHLIYKTKYLAMGCTTTHTDNSDFYEEKIDLEKELYFYDDKWIPL